MSILSLTDDADLVVLNLFSSSYVQLYDGLVFTSTLPAKLVLRAD